jgi:transposase-like protein
MERRRFTREFKFEAVRFIRDRAVSYAQASQDLKVHPTQLRNWVRAFADDPQHAFSGQGQLKPEQLEIARLKREVIKLKAERDILKKAAVDSTGERNMIDFMLSLKDSRWRKWVLCHEYRRSKRRYVTVREMKEGPSRSAIRC